MTTPTIAMPYICITPCNPLTVGITPFSLLGTQRGCQRHGLKGAPTPLTLPHTTLPLRSLRNRAISGRCAYVLMVSHTTGV